MDGASSHCCYDNTGHLIYSGDDEAGSYSFTSHPDGYYPYNSVGRIPHWSHWSKDKLPHLWCCKWAINKEHCLNRFLLNRRTPDCKYHYPSKQGILSVNLPI